MSASDASMFDDELKSLEEQIQSCLRAMDSTAGDARLDKFNRAQELLKSAQKAFHHFKVEIRQLEQPESTIYEKKSREHNQLLTQLKEQLAAKRYESNGAGSPVGGGGGGGDGGGYGAEPDGKEKARVVKDRIQNTQAASLKALHQIEQTVEETKEVGNETAEKLAKQTEQMHRMNEKLDKLDSEVDRAKSELNAFIRRMMTDKIILCFILLIIVAVIVIVVYKFKDGGGDDSPATPPPTPPPHTTQAAETPPN